MQGCTQQGFLPVNQYLPPHPRPKRLKMRLIVVSDWPLFRKGVQLTIGQNYPSLPVIEIDSIHLFSQRYRKNRYGYRDMFIIAHKNYAEECFTLKLMSYREKCFSISRDHRQYCVVSRVSGDPDCTWSSLVQLLAKSSNTKNRIDYHAGLNHDQLNELVHGKSQHPIYLTHKERKVVQALSQGMRNAEIAEYLHMSVFTVKSHISRIFRKTGCSNRTELFYQWNQSTTKEFSPS